MRLLAACCLAVTASFPAPAGAAGGPPEGGRCGFVTVNGTAPDTFDGVIYGGPLVAPGSSVSVICSVKVGTARHADPATVTESSGQGSGAAVLEPRRLTYAAQEWELVYLCTAATVDGTAWYWDAAAEAWSTDPAAGCAPTTEYDVPPPPDDPCFEMMACVDAVTCPAFAAVPPVPGGIVGTEDDGDIHVAGEPFWDCPPYDEWDSAGAAAGPPEGAPCRFAVTNAGGQGTWTGMVDGGPLRAPGSTLTLRCSIHAGNAAHAGPAVAVATAGPAQDAVLLVPEDVSYAAQEDAVQVVCTEATVDGTTWYWTGAAWTTDAGAPCPGGLDRVWDWFVCLERSLCTPDFLLDRLPDDPALDPVRDAVRCAWAGASCPVTCELTPGLPGVPGVLETGADGDVFVLGELFWDCPPYA